MSEDNIMITSNMKHVGVILTMAFTVGVAWATMDGRVEALEDDDDDITVELAKMDKKIERQSSDLNKQAITLGGVVITVKNIEKQMDAHQRLLERIASRLPAPST